ncbi:hypothetical protein [Mongoliibacter ruber]|uniref:Tetratricopeptide repeat protein n=1 Tax=Mongoliibacter ruber TaxID=1750599 RepID=A0A2T0WPC2_9BACT|nr:hypothetical protein [Mongoliibacter ruber]PRY88553.1 hypothetical protein CLW00_104204 [Mongoliibacter ruber]
MSKKKKKPQQTKISPKSYLKQRGRSLPIYKCLVNDEWEENGMAQVIVVRKHVNGNITFGAFLIDIWEKGLKDSFVGFNESEEFLEDIQEKSPYDFIEIEYNLAHNIVYGGLEFSQDQGYKTEKDFNWTKYILEEDTEDIPVIDISFGSGDWTGDEDDSENDDEQVDPYKGVDLILSLTDRVKELTFGTQWLAPDFAQKRIDADKGVDFKELDDLEVDRKEITTLFPVLLEFEEIMDEEHPNEEDLKELAVKIEGLIQKNEEIPQFYELLSNIYLELENDDKVYQTIQKQLNRFPNHFTSVFISGIKLIDLGKIEEVEALVGDALDVKDFRAGFAGLSEFEVGLFYALLCSYFMAKEEFDKAEVYYQLVRKLCVDGESLTTGLQLEVLLKFANHRRISIEKFYNKPFMEVLNQENIKEKITDVLIKNN